MGRYVVHQDLNNRGEAMSSELGQVIRKRRKALDIGLRELARRIDKSPSFLVGLETGKGKPSASESTLRAIASELDLSADRLITLAGKVPADAAPEDELEAELFRRMKSLSEERKREILKEHEDEDE